MRINLLARRVVAILAVASLPVLATWSTAEAAGPGAVPDLIRAASLVSRGFQPG